jgi:sulfite reductase (NADPH) hemoprotein beta-component
VRDQKQAGYSSVTLSLKPAGVAPGDVTDRQLESIANLADQFSNGELRTTHNQNIVIADVIKSQLFEFWQLAKADGLATPTIGTINDMICCPGGDYCSLANAKSIPVAEAIQRRFEDLDYVFDLGDLELNISGCMNACGHHHIGHIGILGVDKKGQEWYQIQLGGSANKNAALAKVLGPSLSRDDVVDGIEKLLDVYVENRLEGEAFLATYQRIGTDKFKERVYAKDA